MAEYITCPEGSLLDRSVLYTFQKPAKGGLYDFQAAAVQHAVGRIMHGESAVVALGTGLGKTCTLRAIIDELQCSAIVVTPGGLVRQTASGLRRLPWEKKDSRAIGTAETGKELDAHAARVATSGDVIVVNRALGIGNGFSHRLLVVDEAHQLKSINAVRRLRSAQAGQPALYLTASPGDAEDLLKIFQSDDHSYIRQRAASVKGFKAFSDACFVVEKTPRVIALIGAAKPRIVEMTVRFSEDRRLNYLNNVAASIRWCPTGLKSKVKMIFACTQQLDGFSQFGARELREMVKDMLTSTTDTFLPIDDEDFRRHAFDMLRQNGLTWPDAPENARRPQLETKEMASVASCACCGLTDAEQLALYKCHTRNFVYCNLTNDVPWSDVNWSAMGSFSSVLVRFPDKRSLQDAIRRHPIPPNAIAFTLTTDMTAAARSRLVNKFASHDGNRLKLAVLRRAINKGGGGCHPGLLKVGAIGCGRFFLSEVTRCLARPRILLADSSIDVGFDIHRHLDGLYVPRVVRTAVDLTQVVGRVSRIAADRGSQGEIDVITTVAAGTLDEYFFKHLKQKASILFNDTNDPATTANEDVLESVKKRIRVLLTYDQEALTVVERMFLDSSVVQSSDVATTTMSVTQATFK